jgi:hypothetical protein
LDELVAFIYDEYAVVTSESTVYRELKRRKMELEEGYYAMRVIF